LSVALIGVQGGSAFVVVNATVAFIKYDLSGNTYYRSCPNESCARKVRRRPLPLSLGLKTAHALAFGLAGGRRRRQLSLRDV
jgi:hypothetical protein